MPKGGVVFILSHRLPRRRQLLTHRHRQHPLHQPSLLQLGFLPPRERRPKVFAQHLPQPQLQPQPQLPHHRPPWRPALRRLRLQFLRHHPLPQELLPPLRQLRCLQPLEHLHQPRPLAPALILPGRPHLRLPSHRSLLRPRLQLQLQGPHRHRSPRLPRLLRRPQRLPHHPPQLALQHGHDR